MPAAKAKGLSKVHFVFRFVMVVIALVGTGLTIRSSMQFRPLQSEYQRLSLEVGNLPIKDPRKVCVAAIPSDAKFEWRFRIYLPANFQARELYSGGAISATTPRRQYTGSGWTSHASRSEPSEYLITIGIFKEGDHWSIHTNNEGSRGKMGLDQRLDALLNNSSPLIIDVAGKEHAAEFGADEPFCLLRIRGAEPIADNETNDPLYLGFYYYFVPMSRVSQFEAAQSATAQPTSGTVP